MKQTHKRRRTHRRGGGLFFPDTYLAPSPLPSPVIGSPWKGEVGDWPGVNGVGGDKNYYSLNTYATDPQTQGVQLYSGGPPSFYRGGKRRRRKGRRTKTQRRKKGGSLLQDAQNIGRLAAYQSQSWYDTLQGRALPVNPLPYRDQLPTNNR